MQANIISDITNAFSNYFLNMSGAEKYSLLIIAASAIFFVILERIFPYTKGQKVFREGFFDDFALYTIAQSYILSIIIFSLIINYIDETTGLSRLKLFTNVPIWLQLVFFTITHDIYIYFMHRWQHSNKWLWRIHEAHHSPKKVDWLSGSRSHALEILLNQTIEFAPIILLGSPPEVIAYKGVISAVWGMYIHSNLNVKSGWLQKIINGPEMHRWHHSTGKGRNRNFATKFAIWDWMFGTAYLPETKPDEYGLKTYFPAHYFNQTLYAFRRFKKKSS
ncbi:MAG: sterol desaturase family protein [Ignavibacteriaceae bacterium]|jgi:sterol desaturase/sphingolipid hydroxylase (fatty acid hydroxylase superfamily)|nr:sterol desaturase family protein [Ignavibacteriaceae bacterium]